MIELLETAPVVNVNPGEYNRLLGYPRDHVLEGRARELADWARDWFAEHGRPWIYARVADDLNLGEDTVRIEGMRFNSERLRNTLHRAEAHGVILAAVGAGPELEMEAHKLWRDEKPDEYFFLEIYGSAVVEHLTMLAGARLCDWAEKQGMAVLPHYSPGYPEWDLVEQRHLLDLMRRRLPCPVDVLESGALQPKKSLLAVFGLTRHVDRVQRLTELNPCSNCSFTPCRYRRSPKPEYTVNTKALKRWAEERLSLETSEDGTVAARFRFDGTTCTNMGRALAFYYDVKLGPREEGYPVREQRCAPVPEDSGHRFMCGYIKDAGGLMSAIEDERPLTGQPLGSVLSWKRAAASTGCYCDAESREHKWGLVLETLHYALRHEVR